MEFKFFDLQFEKLELNFNLVFVIHFLIDFIIK
jgi:hypothetical protein